MRQLATDLWVHETTVRVLGMNSPLRTAVVRLPDGGLWVHSPVPPSEALGDALAALGPVRFLVAANDHHSRWLSDWRAAYPQAAVHVAPGLARRPAGQAADLVFGPGLADCWPGVLRQRFIDGVPLLSETVFLHLASRTLIVTDLVHDYRANAPSGGLWPVMRALGFRGLCIAPAVRLPGVVRDRAAFGDSLRTLCDWDIARIVVCHGAVVEDDAATALRTLARPYLAPGA